MKVDFSKIDPIIKKQASELNNLRLFVADNPHDPSKKVLAFIHHKDKDKDIVYYLSENGWIVGWDNTATIDYKFGGFSNLQYVESAEITKIKLAS